MAITYSDQEIASLVQECKPQYGLFEEGRTMRVEAAMVRDFHEKVISQGPANGRRREPLSRAHPFPVRRRRSSVHRTEEGSDVCEKQYSSLISNRQRIAGFLGDSLLR